MSLEGVQVHLVDSLDVAMECKRWLSTRDEIAVDTEGTGLSPEVDRVRLVQLGDELLSYVVPVEFPGWGALVTELLTRFDGTIVMHNATYDHSMIKSTMGIDLPTHRIHDTRLMAHVLRSTGSLALKKLAVEHVDPRAAVGQDELENALGRSGGWTWATVPITYGPYWQYAGLDTILTQRLKNVLYPRVLRDAPRSYDLELAAAWVCERMARRGARVDREYTHTFAERLRSYCAETETWCESNYGFGPGRSLLVEQTLLRDGVNLVKRTPSGARFSLDKEVLGAVDHPLAEVVLNHRHAQKIVSTYLDTYLELSAPDGLIHASINSVGGTAKNPFEPGGEGGVRTSRMSVSNPNLQNVPIRTQEGRRIRRCFVPREDHTWVMCDAEQIEMRILAHLAQDQGMMDAFTNEGDFFVNMARQLFDEPDFQKSDPRRQYIKNAGYAYAYGAGVEQFARTAGIDDVDVAGRFMHRFAGQFPGVPRFTRNIESIARTRLESEGVAYVRSELTNRRHVADERRPYALVNYLIQGTAGEILKLKLVEADQAGLGRYMVIPVHDEVDLDAPTDELPEVLDTLRRTMNDAKLLSVPLTWSIKTGPSWGECA